MNVETQVLKPEEKFKDITRKCLELLDKYTTLSLKPELFEEFEKEQEELFKRKKEREELGSRAALAKFLGVIREISQLESIDLDIRSWLHGELMLLEEKIEKNGHVELEHLKSANLILREFLDKLYGGTMIQDIRLAVMTPEERELTKRKINIESVDAQELKRVAGKFLYEFQYLWDLYPDIPKRLGLTGDKRSDIERVQNEESRLILLFFDTNWEKTLENLRTIIVSGVAPEGTTVDDAILFYKLTTNKMRTTWFQQLSGYVENFADLGFGIEHLVDRATELRDRIRTRRHVPPGGGDFTPEPVTEEDVAKGEAILNEIFRIVFPRAVADDGVTIDRRKLEQELDISTPDLFFVNLKMGTEKHS
jgi:hypothetical protein